MVQYYTWISSTTHNVPRIFLKTYLYYTIKMNYFIEEMYVLPKKKKTVIFQSPKQNKLLKCPTPNIIVCVCRRQKRLKGKKLLLCSLKIK